MNNSSTYLLYYTASHQRAGVPAKVFRQKIFAQWKLSWQDIYFHGLGLGFDTSFIWVFLFGEAGWIGRETEGDWKRPCPPLPNRYPLAKLIAATEKSRFWAFSRAYGRRNFSQSPLRARNRSSFAIQYPIRSFYDHGSHATSSLGRFSLALQVGRFLAQRPTRLQSHGKAPWGRGWSPWGDQSRGELLNYHRSKKKVTKNVLSARFNLKKAIKTHSTKYLSSTHYELITKVSLEKKNKEGKQGRKRKRKEK